VPSLCLCLCWCLFLFLQASDKSLSPMCYGPVENSHVANYRIAITNFPLSLERKKWSKEESENLEKGIRRQFQEMVLQISGDHFRYNQLYSFFFISLMFHLKSCLEMYINHKVHSSGLGSHSYNLYMHFVHQFVWVPIITMLIIFLFSILKDEKVLSTFTKE